MLDHPYSIDDKPDCKSMSLALVHANSSSTADMDVANSVLLHLVVSTGTATKARLTNDLPSAPRQATSTPEVSNSNLSWCLQGACEPIVATKAAAVVFMLW